MVSCQVQKLDLEMEGCHDLLPLEVNDAADDLKLIQVEVADLWHPWGSRAMTSSPSLNRAADQLKDDDL